MRTIALLLEYDGARYAGWQFQENALGIQEVVEKALAKLTGEKVRVLGAGRTDAGVHAEGQVCSFRTKRDLPLTAFSAGANKFLPPDVRILEAAEKAADFDAMRSAKRKCYAYRVLHRTAPTALQRERAWHVPYKLNWARLRRVLPLLEGRHDFAAFRAASAAGQKTSVRRIEKAGLQKNGPLYTIYFVGDGFLRNQVRSMVGTLVEIARGVLPEERIAQVLLHPDRRLVGPTAPAWGLTLEWVDYGEGPWRAPGGALWREGRS